MHKDGKWAKMILALQEPDGKWGCFHSLSKFYGAPITTEQALRRLERLGFTGEDKCVQKALSYMNDCLTGKNRIPDRAEKVHDWDIFTSLILAAWIRRFTSKNAAANKTADQWAKIIMEAFSGGIYDHDRYVSAYRDILGMKPCGSRLIDFMNFYPISLVSGCLDEKTETALVKYALSKKDGIYYIYERPLCILPEEFASRETVRYLDAIELLARYKSAKSHLQFVRDWLIENRAQDGAWDFGKDANDKIHFPLSDDWRTTDKRKKDSTEWIQALVNHLTIE
ncbi:MAG: hypothetical protein IKJ65_00075 [Clostridia bacterium]|nr:hypothetical protein [Clostridia bacterium]